MNLTLCWAVVLAAAAAFVGGVLYLHDQRPDDGTLRLEEARFAPVEDLRRPKEDAYGAPLSLPHDWRKSAITASTGWYRLLLDLEVAPNRLWGLYVPGLEMTPTFYVNDAEVGGFDPDQPLPRYWNRPLYFSIPSGLLHPGKNVVEVRLAANGNWGRLSEIYLGPDQSLRPEFERRRVLRVSLLYVTAIMGLVVSAFIAIMYLARRESIYMWFSLFALAWSLQNYFMLTVRPPMANPLWDLFAYVLFGFMLVTGTIFTMRFLSIREPVVERLLIGTSFVGPLVLLSVMPLDYAFFNRFSTVVWFGVLMVLMVYPLILMARAVVGLRSLEVVALAICYLIITALAVHDWSVVTGVGYRHNGLMLQFAAAPTLATFGVILVLRFLRALRDGDLLKSNLEALVAEKTQEITETMARFREVEGQRLVLAERARLMRDMHDGIGSQLIGTLSRLQPEDDREREIAAELHNALNELRVMIDSLDDVGDDLLMVLGLFRNRIQPQLDGAGLRLHWDVQDLPPVPGLGPERVLHFLRMMQEVVTNAIKHADAANLWIRTFVTPGHSGCDTVVVQVEDDGIGLPDGHVPGRGIKNLRYRARAAGVGLSIGPSASGTLVEIAFALAHRGSTESPP